MAILHRHHERPAVLRHPVAVRDSAIAVATLGILAALLYGGVTLLTHAIDALARIAGAMG